MNNQPDAPIDDGQQNADRPDPHREPASLTLEERLEQETLAREAAESELASIRQTLNKTRLQTNVADQAIEKSIAEANRLRSERDRIKKAYEDIKQEQSKTEQQLSLFVHSAEDTESQLAALRTTVESLQHQLESAVSERDAALVGHQQLRSENEQLFAETKRIAVAQQNELGLAEQENSRLRLQSDEDARRIQELESKRSDSERIIRQAEQQRLLFERRCEQLQCKLEQVQREQQAQERETPSLETVRGQHEESAPTTQEALEDAIRQRDQISSDLETLRSFVAEQQKTNAEMALELESVQDERDRLRKECEKSEARFKALQANLYESESRRKELAAAKSAKPNSKELEQAKAKAVELADLLKRQSQTLSEIEKQKRQLERKLNESEAALEKATQSRQPTVTSPSENRQAAESPRESEAKTNRMASRKKNDLRLIEGIGPKLEKLLLAANITTFKKLAGASKKKLREIVAGAGPRYKSCDPSSWQEQARLAGEEKWSDLERLQLELKSRVPSKKVQSETTKPVRKTSKRTDKGTRQKTSHAKEDPTDASTLDELLQSRIALAQSLFSSGVSWSDAPRSTSPKNERT